MEEAPRYKSSDSSIQFSLAVGFYPDQKPGFTALSRVLSRLSFLATVSSKNNRRQTL
jgi:hypothetical protein